MKAFELVRDELKKQQKSDVWLSEQTGISAATLRSVRYESRRQYSLKTMVKIAIALDLDLNELKKIDWDE